MLDTEDLSRNLSLARFELRVDPDELNLIPPFLHETLSTISSPVFSELALRLEGSLIPYCFLHSLSIKVVWGDEWGMIDKYLNDMVHATGRDIKFVVQVGKNGGVRGRELRGFVGSMFPLMNARGLVRVLAPSSLREGERFIW